VVGFYPGLIASLNWHTGVRLPGRVLGMFWRLLLVERRAKATGEWRCGPRKGIIAVISPGLWLG